MINAYTLAALSDKIKRLYTYDLATERLKMLVFEHVIFELTSLEEMKAMKTSSAILVVVTLGPSPSLVASPNFGSACWKTKLEVKMTI